MRNVFFENGVEIGAAETKSAHTGAPYAIRRNGPRFQFSIDAQRGVVKIDIRIGMLAMHAGRQYFIAKCQCGLQQSHGARGRLEMSDVRFDRSERHRAARKLITAEHFIQALRLHHVTHGRGCAMTFDQRCGSGRQPGILPGALDGQFLADRVGRGDAFPLPVAGSCDASQHSVDVVAVAFGIRQPFQHEEHGAFSHHETVRSLREGTNAGSGERADLAELDKGGSTHVAIDAAGDGHVEIIFYQTLHGRSHCRHGGSASGVYDEIRSAEVEYVRNAAGQATAQFTGHGVFRNFGKPLADADVEFADDVASHRLRQSGETRGFFQLMSVLRKVDS